MNKESALAWYWLTCCSWIHSIMKLLWIMKFSNNMFWSYHNTAQLMELQISHMHYYFTHHKEPTFMTCRKAPFKFMLNCIIWSPTLVIFQTGELKIEKEKYSINKHLLEISRRFCCRVKKLQYWKVKNEYITLMNLWSSSSNVSRDSVKFSVLSELTTSKSPAAPCALVPFITKTMATFPLDASWRPFSRKGKCASCFSFLAVEVRHSSDTTNVLSSFLFIALTNSVLLHLI